MGEDLTLLYTNTYYSSNVFRKGIIVLITLSFFIYLLIIKALNLITCLTYF